MTAHQLKLDIHENNVPHHLERFTKDGLNFKEGVAHYVFRRSFFSDDRERFCLSVDGTGLFTTESGVFQDIQLSRVLFNTKIKTRHHFPQRKNRFHRPNNEIVFDGPKRKFDETRVCCPLKAIHLSGSFTGQTTPTSNPSPTGTPIP
ncbi:hypothetical protein AVEN_6721-1 [Araneus ventricosus]|uniref:Uncharacterized protein n=1 Tax=Araneus ventricosus TaxID=182803 RepID=A0A4Y2P720_ARAVE|nr:hypothetical protein AVEN_246423-1 [Araneus ventricosus]GBN46853.1 hypothetical protein AVEN_6721-1 [Araneus ventricosus]